MAIEDRVGFIVGSGPMPDSKKKPWFGWLRMLSVVIIFAFAVISCLTMLGLFVAAFWQFGQAIWILLEFLPPPKGMTIEGSGIERTIRGVELLFLAPLGYLVLTSLAQYCFKGGDPAAKAQLAGVKGLVLGLLIALIASDLVDRILKNGLEYQAAFAES